MSRGAKPTKAKAKGAAPRPSHKKPDASRERDLEKRLAEAVAQHGPAQLKTKSQAVEIYSVVRPGRG